MLSIYLQLATVNDKMAEYTSTPEVSSRNAALMHTLQRHRDILQVQTVNSQVLQSHMLFLKKKTFSEVVFLTVDIFHVTL